MALSEHQTLCFNIFVYVLENILNYLIVSSNKNKQENQSFPCFQSYFETVNLQIRTRNQSIKRQLLASPI